MLAQLLAPARLQRLFALSSRRVRQACPRVRTLVKGSGSVHGTSAQRHSQSTRETTWTPPPEWATPGAGAGGSAAELAQTLERTFVQKADLAEPLGHSTPLQARTQDSPSLYARDTDIDTEEEVRA